MDLPEDTRAFLATLTQAFSVYEYDIPLSWRVLFFQVPPWLILTIPLGDGSNDVCHQEKWLWDPSKSNSLVSFRAVPRWANY